MRNKLHREPVGIDIVSARLAGQVLLVAPVRGITACSFGRSNDPNDLPSLQSVISCHRVVQLYPRQLRVFESAVWTAQTVSVCSEPVWAWETHYFCSRAFFSSGVITSCVGTSM